MGKFDVLTRHMFRIENSDFSKWEFYEYRVGLRQDPVPEPFADYPESVYFLADDVDYFRVNHEEYGMERFLEILDENGIKWGRASMTDAQVEQLDGQGVMALLMGAVRAEYSRGGALIEFCKNGSVLRWLRRLKELDNEEEDMKICS